MWALNQILPEKITTEESRIYGRHAANWTYLSAFLASGADLHELGILLYIELNGKKRDFMISRLLGKIGTAYRTALQNECAELISEKK